MTVGRRPLPTVLKVLRGTDRPERLPNEEPKPKRRMPRPPAHVQGVALEEWKRISKRLHRQKLLTENDGSALAAYCIAYERWADAEEKLRKFGTVIKSPRNFLVQSPYLSISNRAMEQMLRVLTEFGMTPSSRSRIDIDPAGSGGADEW